MKRKGMLLLIISILVLSVVPVWADTSENVLPRLVDEADLLDEDVEEELADKLDNLAEEYELDAVVVLVDDYETYVLDDTGVDGEFWNETPGEFAEAYYRNGGFGSDAEDSGIILLVSMEERDWYIYIQGAAREAVNNYGFDFISDRLTERLGSDDYEDAVVRYVEDLELFFEAYDNGSPYGSDNTVKTPGKIFTYFGIAIGASAIMASAFVSIIKGRMNTARPQNYAREYVKQGSFVLTNQQDLYLYTNTTKTAIPKSSSGGSGGGSRSGSRGGRGGGGKF